MRLRAFAIFGLAILIAVTAFPGQAQAATFTVTKTADTADGTCDADCSLREAIIAANIASPNLTNNSDTEDTAVIPIPCTFDLRLGYADDTLTMDFTLGTPEPATWDLWLVIPGTGIFPIWSLPLPVIDPPIFPTLSFPFPGMGTIGFLTALSTSEGITCSDWATVDTGAPSSAVPSISELRELLSGPSVVLPSN